MATRGGWPGPQPAHISGVFLYWRGAKVPVSAGEWEQQLGFLQGLGMDTIITQFSVVNGKAYYPSDRFAVAEPQDSDRTGALLSAAEQVGFAVHLGLASDDDNWWEVPYHPERLPGYVKQESARNNLIARELIGRYGESPALAGIYLSHEIHLGEEWSGERMPYLVELFNRMCDEVKRMAPRLVVSTAPFFSLRGSMEEFEERWRQFLSRARLDVVMLQDGVGCERDITVDNMVPYYQAMARACQETGRELWTDLELFDLKPPKVVSPERIAAQLAGEAPYVTKVVAYSLANLTPEFAASLPGVKLA